LPVLRRKATAPPSRFVVAGGLALPATSLLLIAWLLSGTSGKETRDVLIAAAVGGVVYVVGRAGRKQA